MVDLGVERWCKVVTIKLAGSVDLIYSVQDSRKWRDFVDKAMNLWVT